MLTLSNKSEFIEFFKTIKEVKLLKYYPYPSVVRGRLLQQVWSVGDAPKSEEHQFLTEFGDWILKQLKEQNSILLDNKIAIEFRPVDPLGSNGNEDDYTSFYLGNYDSCYCIGIAANQRDGVEPISLTTV